MSSKIAAQVWIIVWAKALSTIQRKCEQISYLFSKGSSNKKILSPKFWIVFECGGSLYELNTIIQINWFLLWGFSFHSLQICDLGTGCDFEQAGVNVPVYPLKGHMATAKLPGLRRNIYSPRLGRKKWESSGKFPISTADPPLQNSSLFSAGLAALHLPVWLNEWLIDDVATQRSCHFSEIDKIS